jgi:proline dehydrogenase
MTLVHDLALRFAKHWIAGEQRSDAIARAHEVNALGMCALVNYLGEDTIDPEVISRNVDEYHTLAAELKQRGFCSSISVKPTQLGIQAGVDTAIAPAREIIIEASKLGMFVWFDMEGYSVKNLTLDMFHRLHEDHQNIGVCIQAYLRDTWEDLKLLVDRRSIVRVVKGAYREPENVRFTDRQAVRWNFMRCVRLLGERTDLSFAVGTHDDYLIDEIRKMSFGLSPPEFQLLLGVKDELKKELAESGYSVSVYIPYGTDWFGYAKRRIRERPENALLLGRSLVTGR